MVIHLRSNHHPAKLPSWPAATPTPTNKLTNSTPPLPPKTRTAILLPLIRIRPLLLLLLLLLLSLLHSSNSKPRRRSRNPPPEQTRDAAQRQSRNEAHRHSRDLTTVLDAVVWIYFLQCQPFAETIVLDDLWLCLLCRAGLRLRGVPGAADTLSPKCREGPNAGYFVVRSESRPLLFVELCLALFQVSSVCLVRAAWYEAWTVLCKVFMSNVRYNV